MGFIERNINKNSLYTRNPSSCSGVDCTQLAELLSLSVPPSIFACRLPATRIIWGIVGQFLTKMALYMSSIASITTMQHNPRLICDPVNRMSARSRLTWS